MKRLFLTIVAIVMAAAGVQAFTGEIDGIRYDVDTSAKVAKVIEKNPKYTGDIVIPASIVVEEVECAVTSIWGSAFYGCTGLTSVSIPSSVTTIEYGAFWSCTKLADVYCYAEALPRTEYYEGYDIFYCSDIEYSTLHVPASAIDKYRTKEPWKKFGTIVEISHEDAVSEVKAVPVMIQRDGNRLSVDGAPAGTMINVYDLSGRMIGQGTANEGVTRVDVTGDEKVVVVKVGERSVKVVK